MEIGRFALALVGHFLASLLYVLQRLHLVEAVVDTSSILEHREELRELWEKRMMADENQSSSSSVTTETDSKPLREDESEEKVVKSESELNSHAKIPNGLSNGYVKHSDVPDSNANHIHENVLEKKETSSVDADHENNNSADSLEEDNIEDFVEQKTYTSNMEQALIMTETKEVTSSETVISTTTVQEVCQTQECITKVEEITSSLEEHNTEVVESVDVQKEAELEITTSKEEDVLVNELNAERKEQAIESAEKAAFVSEENANTQVEESVVEVNKSVCDSVSDKIVIPDVSQDDDDDGFVRVEECLPKDDNPDVPLDLPEENENSIDHDTPSSNGFEDQSLPVSPISSISGEKVNQPEMEQFVKSGGVKRIIPGVQKTEQPYNSCTTETKIAMEIREMREREEELRIMREQALISPVVSPVPPKTCSPSVRTPSPSPKESLSPTPPGPGYRVSSVFGHRGISPSPSIDEEKKSFNKSFNKESAVEKEIRLAKDREEELRKQKGLPPREDDSYVKPSQVKSSQVRVFGKMAGTNSTNIKQAATAKIQMEIEEQTQREMALREMGHIQTISQERTDAKVAKLKTAETVPHTNGNSHSPVNGNHTNGRDSPDTSLPYKRSSPSPTNARPASIFAQNNGISKGNISMHKFISSKGKETTFSSPRNGPFQPKEETVSRSVVPPPMVKLKRNVSVESKIQQEIMEMKMREEELRKMHLNASNGNSMSDDNDMENEINQKNSLEYENGNGIVPEEISPRHNKLIAQWEQRIQKAES